MVRPRYNGEAVHPGAQTVSSGVGLAAGGSVFGDSRSPAGSSTSVTYPCPLTQRGMMSVSRIGIAKRLFLRFITCFSSGGGLGEEDAFKNTGSWVACVAYSQDVCRSSC